VIVERVQRRPERRASRRSVGEVIRTAAYNVAPSSRPRSRVRSSDRHRARRQHRGDNPRGHRSPRWLPARSITNAAARSADARELGARRRGIDAQRMGGDDVELEAMSSERSGAVLVGLGHSTENGAQSPVAAAPTAATASRNRSPLRCTRPVDRRRHGVIAELSIEARHRRTAVRATFHAAFMRGVLLVLPAHAVELRMGLEDNHRASGAGRTTRIGDRGELGEVGVALGAGAGPAGIPRSDRATCAAPAGVTVLARDNATQGRSLSVLASENLSLLPVASRLRPLMFFNLHDTHERSRVRSRAACRSWWPHLLHV